MQKSLLLHLETSLKENFNDLSIFSEDHVSDILRASTSDGIGKRPQSLSLDVKVVGLGQRKHSSKSTALDEETNVLLV